VVPSAPRPLVRFVASCMAPLEERPFEMAMVLDALASLRRLFSTPAVVQGETAVRFPERTHQRPATVGPSRVQVPIASQMTPQLPFVRTEEAPRAMVPARQPAPQIVVPHEAPARAATEDRPTTRMSHGPARLSAPAATRLEARAASPSTPEAPGRTPGPFTLQSPEALDAPGVRPKRRAAQSLYVALILGLAIGFALVGTVLFPGRRESESVSTLTNVPLVSSSRLLAPVVALGSPSTTALPTAPSASMAQAPSALPVASASSVTPRESASSPLPVSHPATRPKPPASPASRPKQAVDFGDAEF